MTMIIFVRHRHTCIWHTMCE